jgi:hypothetical protein
MAVPRPGVLGAAGDGVVMNVPALVVSGAANDADLGLVAEEKELALVDSDECTCPEFESDGNMVEVREGEPGSSEEWQSSWSMQLSTCH